MKKKKRKNIMAQAMAWLALFAIVIGIVGTGILVLFSSGDQSGYDDGSGQSISIEELQKIANESQITVEPQQVEVTSSGSVQ